MMENVLDGARGEAIKLLAVHVGVMLTILSICVHEVTQM